MHTKILYYIDLVKTLTKKELKVRYKSSVLGYLWSTLHPLAFAFVFYVAFKIFMKIPMQSYALFLIAGLFPWQWFSNSVNSSSTVFLGNASLIKKVNFPRNFLVLTLVLNDMIHFLLSIPVIVLFIFIYHKSPSLSWIYGIPALLIVQFFITYGLALAVSSINLFFRDLERLISIFLTLLFYVTPIIYPETMIPEKYRGIVNLNPLSPLMINWRNLFLEGKIDFQNLFLSLFYAVIIYIAGYLIYRKLSWRFAEIL